MTTKTAEKAFATRNDLPKEARADAVELINANLLNLIDLYSQTKYAHWNLKGLSFIGVHKLLDELAEHVEDAIDETAERATALGGIARGTVRHAAEGSALEEFPSNVFDIPALIAALADRFATAAKGVRDGIDAADELGDKDTADMFTDTSRMLDKSLWLLEAHITK